jgi:hypothetical protein
VRIERQLDDLLTDVTLLSFATTAAAPHVKSLDRCAPGTVVLNISLRDLSPEKMALAQNGLRKIFSPFGLGILDIALGEYVLQLALKHGSGMTLHSFLPN